MDGEDGVVRSGTPVVCLSSEFILADVSKSVVVVVMVLVSVVDENTEVVVVSAGGTLMLWESSVASDGEADVGVGKGAGAVLVGTPPAVGSKSSSKEGECGPSLPVCSC